MTTTTEQTNEPTRFEVGRTYWCRSAADHNCVWHFTVTARTAKFITIRDRWGEESRVGVRVWAADNEERAKPLGTFSMSPTLTASRETITLAEEDES
jgi:hypothetical protein